MRATQKPTNSKIELLPEHIIDQIKAGEVIERPASLLKEIIENSVDAGSTKIQIELRDNGLELISIIDNGKGIEYEELPLAFCRHATSKIRKFEDIYSLHSYGFRGEALASIASISRVSCTSITQDNNGGKYLIYGGEEIEHSPVKSNESGTSLYIKDLFYNTPARLKFVKSKISEKNALKRIINSFILNNPQISFSIKWDKEEKEFFPALSDNNKTERLKQIFYKKSNSKQEVYFSSNEYDGYSAQLFISSNSSKSNSSREQFLFTNNRLFTDKALHQIICKNLGNVWGPNQFGHYCLIINAPTNEIDVNAHPSKTFIKFLKSDVIYSLTKTVARTLNERHGSEQIKTASENSFKNSNKSGQLFFQQNPTSDLESPINLSQHSFKLNNEISIINTHTDSFICHSPAVFSEIIEYFISKNDSDIESTPLLISEYYNLNSESKNKLPFLNDYGFEFENIAKNEYMLKSFPSFLSDLPYIELLNSFFENNDEENLLDLFIDSSKSITISTKSLTRFLEERNQISLKSIKKINQKLIAKIFNEK